MNSADVDGALPKEEAVLLMAVDMPVAGWTCRRGARLNGFGWVLSRSSVAEISVSAGEAHLAYATYGLYRPDLAEAFPQYPNADHSGFSFSASLDLAPAEETEIIFSVRTLDGEVHTETVPIRIVDEPADSAAPDESGDGVVWSAPLQLRVDRSTLDLNGELRVSGWAVARTPLEYVKVYAGETLLGTAVLGMPRPDIAQEWCEYPNAATPGFSFACAVSKASGEIRMVRVEAAAGGGVVREVVAPVTPSVVPAEPGADIMFHCDHVSLSAGGRLVISGWCASPYGIQAADVLFDGGPIGQAELGMPRPDVEQAFPALAHAAESGLVFAHQLAEPVPGEHVVILNIRAGNGVLRVASLPVAAEATQVEIESLLRLEIDAPALAGGSAPAPVRGGLRIEGWAIARAGVETVCAFIDDVKSGEAYCGLRREDVAAAYTDWSGALWSGFGMSMPAKLLTPGEHSVRVVLRDRVGRERSTTFSVTVERPADRVWPEALRRRIPASEKHLHELVLSSLGRQPRFDLYMPFDELQIDAARATLPALFEQEYGNWRAYRSAGRRRQHCGCLLGAGGIRAVRGSRRREVSREPSAGRRRSITGRRG